MPKKFQKNNTGFTCLVCSAIVPPHPTSSRDHCNVCLCGQHVDINPGDRLHDCQGILKPIGLETANQKTRIVYECEKCGERKVNVTAKDDAPQKLLQVAAKVYSVRP